ncbi:hypothetical protein Q3G72_020197 [Acer saccharum]|nr:hypothetical protein Q3G72_020197 [Acer saccharum]
MLGKAIPALSLEKNIFFIIKAFAAGVILASGFIHVLPDAFENLTSPASKTSCYFSGVVAWNSGAFSYRRDITWCL